MDIASAFKSATAGLPQRRNWTQFPCRQEPPSPFHNADLGIMVKPDGQLELRSARCAWASDCNGGGPASCPSPDKLDNSHGEIV